MAIAVPLIWNFSMLNLYYKFTTLTGILSVFGLAFCALIYIKGKYRTSSTNLWINNIITITPQTIGLILPDPGEHDLNGNPIFDFYWGIELYPHLGKYISLKVLINSRFGLFLWQLIVLAAWKANYELYYNRYSKGELVWPMTVTTILQTVYLAKFYYWEDGYMQVCYG